jgi:prepilin-type processing-associated H-X9-DG protein
LNWQLVYYGNGSADGSGVLNDVASVARNDYCANGYDLVRMEKALVDTITAPAAANVLAGGIPVADAEVFDKPAVLSELVSIIKSSNGAKGGIVYPLGNVTMAEIADGTSNTYLCGEKYIELGCYENGECWGDQATLYSGYDAGNVRFSCKDTFPRAMQDSTNVNPPTLWGGVHAGAFPMGFCDGSVRPVSYGINPQVHDHLGHRSDGNVVDLGAIDQ